MTPADLEAKIKRIEDTEAISQLTAKFTYLIDAQDWQSMLDLFTDDCVFDVGNVYKGKEELAGFLRDEFPATYSFSTHMLHNMIVDVQGDTATGQWYVETPVTLRKENQALWVLGKYENQYARVNGEWKFKVFVSKAIYVTPFEESWAKTKQS